MGFIKKLGAAALRVASYVQTAAAGTAPDAVVFINPASSGEVYEIVEVSYNYDVVGGSGAVADVKVVPSGTALASGTSALASTMDLTATARTIRKATLSATKTARLVKAGESVAVDTGGTLTGLTGLGIVITLAPLNRATRR
jgi:hypothetical protein